MDSETLYLLAKLQGGAVTVTATTGAPTSGTWVTGNLVLDSVAVLWVCQAGGAPGRWVRAATPWLTPVSVSSNYAALNGECVEATAALTVTSPLAGAGNRFSVIADYAASGASPVVVTAASGYLIGPGISASTTSIDLTSPNATISFLCDGTNWLQVAGSIGPTTQVDEFTTAYTLTATLTTFLTTSSLTVGTWLIITNVTYDLNITTTSQLVIKTVLGSASGTVTPSDNSCLIIPGVVATQLVGNVTNVVVATVTSPGTIEIQASLSSPGGTSYISGGSGVTYVTEVKIA